jgi:predicted nucleic acid-binding protein
MAASGRRGEHATRIAQPPLLLIDTDVILDVLLQREEWLEGSGMVLTLCDEKKVRGCVASHSITNIYYLVRRKRDREAATLGVAALLSMLRVVPIEGPDFQQALVFGMEDFEDAVQVAAALKVGADYIITRNRKHYPERLIQTRTPAEYWAVVAPDR